jgi:hypothetical protein
MRLVSWISWMALNRKFDALMRYFAINLRVRRTVAPGSVWRVQRSQRRPGMDRHQFH